MTSMSGSEQSLSESASSGVLNRLIEHWLTKTPERGFEVPFAQLLMSEGMTVVHIDRHSPHEQGKDIIATAVDGSIHGYQLKQGDINGSSWDREVHHELGPLCDLAAMAPQVRGKPVIPNLVTTGVLSQEAQFRLNSYNDSLRHRGRPEITLHDRRHLQQRFARVFGAFLPLQPPDMRALLSLHISDGRQNLDRSAFWEVLLQSTPIDANKTRARHAIAALPVLAAYACASKIQEGNHLSQVEAWAITAARIARIGLSSQLRPPVWQPGFSLSRDAAFASLASLCDEALASKHLLEGDGLGDGGPVFQCRALIVCGCLATWRLIARLRGSSKRDDAPVLERIRHLLPHTLPPYGEAAHAYVWPIFWFMREHAQHTGEAENFLLTYTAMAARLNSLERERTSQLAQVGLLSPFEPLDHCLKLRWSADLASIVGNRTYRGHVYTVKAMVLQAARDLRRSSLKLIWPWLCDVAHCEMQFDHPLAYLDFKTDEAIHTSGFFPRPTSWAQLTAEAESTLSGAADRLPVPLRSDLEFALLYALACPHRLDRHLSSLIGHSLKMAL